jgi:DNA (cytosine-5)-methyltransferase 1
MGLSAISLFSGAGGLDLAAKWAGIRTVCYVEWDRDCQKNLISRMRSNELDDAPIFDDVRSFDGKPWAGKVDIVFGGFPCQPHSAVGEKRGGADDRNLFPDTLRILRECRAWGFIGENVRGILTNGFAAEVLESLEREGFCGNPYSNTSCAVGGSSARFRVFFIAHSKSIRLAKNTIQKEVSREIIEQGKHLRPKPSVCLDLGRHGTIKIPSNLRVESGMEARMDRIGPRLKRCGNGVDPYSAFPAFKKIVRMSEAPPRKEV